jgi:pyruvate dehydrogenase E1 component beta subunit
MATMTLIQAVNTALRYEMERDDRVVVLGEDVGINGGVFRATEGLYEQFGEDRVIDTPLNESGIVGLALGMAVHGLRPVAEIQFADFIWPAFDQITSEVSKFRYKSGNMFTAPMVLRTPYGGGIRGGHYHSQSIETYFVHTAGLKVIVPSTPADAYGLLLTALRDPDPVLFLEPKALYRKVKGEVPEGEHTVAFGRARLVREGSDLTLIGYGAMVPVCEAAARRAQEANISVEVLDVRSLMPLDEEAILGSVARTGRVVIVHEAARFGGYGGEIAALLAEKGLLYLEAPVVRVAGFDTPFPYSLESFYMPDDFRVWNAINKVIDF